LFATIFEENNEEDGVFSAILLSYKCSKAFFEATNLTLFFPSSTYNNSATNSPKFRPLNGELFLGY
jgi:hypothetical protein